MGFTVRFLCCGWLCVWGGCCGFVGWDRVALVVG